MYGCTALPWIGPGRTSATCTTRSSRFSGRVRRMLCCWARLSIWKSPIVSASWICAYTSGVVERDPREVDRLALRPRDLLDAVLDRREHPEPEQVDLQEAGVVARVLVPLAHLPAGHGRRHHRDKLDERPRRDHHPARVLRDVARQPGDLRGHVRERPPARGGPLRLEARHERELLRDPPRVPAVGDAGEALELGMREPERLAHVPDRAARAVGRERGDEGGVLAAVLLGDRDDQLLADVAREVEVDVRHRHELAVEEAPERQVGLHRIDVREAGQVADDRADGAPPAAARRQDGARRVPAPHLQRHLARELEHLVVEEEEAGQAEVVDEGELVVEPLARQAPVPVRVRRSARRRRGRRSGAASRSPARRRPRSPGSGSRARW